MEKRILRAASLSLMLAFASARLLVADEALVATATNFSGPLQQLQAAFERSSDHSLKLTTGSTGTLYAQILNGAPFDLFLAADQHRPFALVQKQLAVSGSRFTYATGRLVLWSPNPDRITEDGVGVLRRGKFRRLAIANPELAPYGLAARQTLTALGLITQLKDRIVMGQNIGQTHALIATGNAELGLIALSQSVDRRFAATGSRWIVPHHLHDPIHQDVVLMKRAVGNRAAQAFLEYLKSREGQTLIAALGYGVE